MSFMRKLNSRRCATVFHHKGDEGDEDVLSIENNMAARKDKSE